MNLPVLPLKLLRNMVKMAYNLGLEVQRVKPQGNANADI